MSAMKRRTLLAILALAVAAHPGFAAEAASRKTAKSQPSEVTVFLSSLPEKDVTVAYGTFSKDGTIAYFGGDGCGPQVVVQGVKEVGHTLSAHGPSHIRYDLKGAYHVLKGSVAVNNDPHTGHAVLIFSVIGDGKPLWTSATLNAPLLPVPFTVEVMGVDKLELEIKTPTGDNGGCHAVWIEPQLITYPPLIATARANLRLGLEQEQRGNLGKAMDLYRDAVKQGGGQDFVAEAQSRLDALAQQRDTEVAAVRRQVEERAPEAAAACRKLVKTYGKNRVPEADDLLKQANQPGGAAAAAK
jgi:hypothetical protein